MWFVTRGTPDAHRNLRHACEQGQVGRYGWQMHDGATFGTHEVVDSSAIITTSFVKHGGGDQGALYNWSRPSNAKVCLHFQEGTGLCALKAQAQRALPSRSSSVRDSFPCLHFVAARSLSLYLSPSDPLCPNATPDVRNEEDALKVSGLSAPKKKGMDRLRIDGSHSALGAFSIFAKEGTSSAPLWLSPLMLMRCRKQRVAHGRRECEVQGPLGRPRQAALHRRMATSKCGLSLFYPFYLSSISSVSLSPQAEV